MDGSVKEVHQVMGQLLGGNKVNEEFKKLLLKLFGSPRLHDYQQLFAGDWLVLMNNFEMKKRSNTTLNGETTRIQLPRSFISWLWEKETDLESMIKDHYNPRDVKIDDMECLCLSQTIMGKLFQPVLIETVSHLKGLLRKPSMSKVTVMLLVGGFAESTLLQSEVQKELSDIRVIWPQSAGIAVVQGAVMYGRQPPSFILFLFVIFLLCHSIIRMIMFSFSN